MNTYTTLIYAVCPRTGELFTYEGPYIKAISESDARRILDSTGRGYCHVSDILDSEVDEHTGKTTIYHNNN